ncbi:hypothetical protein HDU78_000663 [Chytriomyces hyalinus]|uniref:Large ribosomal subunit protein mL59 domain-containing protein n=1 Tax=Chytriomyces confervae TaxID=246404 RepID=A0A507FR05_9FUNG|nr:hypothetical protein HDU78_000663 [Chytriomyces hyalinus]KAJ3265754.1 hypothetical protein HDU77_004022 [Chytriomyces hyalinus]KAJ3397677.1 hypothetical protein HDU80_009486 [Chytriomyces hyalinus]TPX78693.1 hypothetical protein CcCBS67573_g00049 [Chytriomyces confervae]
MKLPTSLPARMPPPSVLRYIAFPPSPSGLLPTVSIDGEKRPPRIPFRMQARIKKACVLADIDPKIILPNLAAAANTPRSDSVASAPSTFKIPKGNKREIKSVERQFRIEENMAKMDEKIKAWKEEKKKAKVTKRSEIPF